MNLKWTEPVVVITGASSGIGKASARQFAEKGARLVLAARRKNLLDDLVDELANQGCEAIAVEADVSDKEDVQEIAKQAIREFGRIDVWVNNAGVGAVGRFDEIPLEEHDQLIRTNLMGVIYGSSAALRLFRRRGQGVLINVASVEGKQAFAYHASYAASKHAIVGLSSALRQELSVNKERNIFVCTVMPAAINTPFFRHSANFTGKKVVAPPPVYAPEQVAKTIVKLAWSPEEEAYVGGLGRFMGAQSRVARKFSDRQAGWLQQRKQIKEAPEGVNKSGALFEPDEEGIEAKDEWTESGRIVDPTAIALGAIIPVAAGIWYWKRRSVQNRERERDYEIRRAS
jgi:short-subunit dehydrogenase